MTCPTCKDENRDETCGANKTGEECTCCGMIIVATAEEQENEANLEE